MKYRFVGIGEASAAMLMAALLSNPSTASLAVGPVGKIVFFFAKYIFMFMASCGLIILNVGAAKVEVIIDKGNFDGSWDKAEKAIDDIRKTGRELTPDEIAKIDAPVIDAFRKFGSFGRVRDPKGNT